MNDDTDKNERFTWKTVHGWQTPAFLKVMNGLDKKNQRLKEENEQLKGEIKRLKCINKQLEERLDKDVALNMDCGDVE